MPARRIGCLWVPQFSIWVLRRARPELQRRSLIVGGAPAEGRRTVVAFSAEAKAAGVRLGMLLREAQLRCPDAVFLPADEEAEQVAQEQLLELLERFSPNLENIRPGVLLFDAAGLERQHASEDTLAAAIIRAVENELAAQPHVGLAGTRFCARVAAAYGAPVRMIPPGGERAFLAPLPVEHLPDLEPWRWRLQFLGIRTIGDFATRLPYNDVVVRYGPAAAQAHLLARGLDPTPLRPLRDREAPTAVQRFEPPEERLEPLVFTLKRHLDRLCAELTGEGWLCSLLRLHCRCDGAEDVTFSLRPAEPSATAGRLRDLLRWNIERRLLAAEQAGGRLFGRGITQFELQLDGLLPAVGQALDLFSAGRAGKRNVLGAIERLEALLGAESVRRAIPAAGRRPEESFTWAPYRPAVLTARKTAPRSRRAPSSPPSVPPAPTAAAARVQPLPLPVVADGRPSRFDATAGRHPPALRLFDPPILVQVHERDGTLTTINAGRGPEAIALQAGPWRLDERWWGAGAAARDYFQVATRQSHVYLLFREGESWFAQGAFD
ncbi:MAG: DNA polymerase Y family protein [Chloroflexota bacterium]